MLLLFYSLALILSLYFLAVICDRYFVDSLDKISQNLKMNSDMAGATLMAIGSSAPELFVALMALFKSGHESIGAGTIVGSALFNVLVIIGASAMVRKTKIFWQPVIRDVIFYSLSIIWLLISFGDGLISSFEALVFVVFYGIYIVAVLNWKKWLPYKDEQKIVSSVGENKKIKRDGSIFRLKKSINKGLDWVFPSAEKYWLSFFVSIVVIAGLAYVLVESAVAIATTLNIPAVIIGLTVLAIGTSVPDLMSSLIVARQGRGSMAISNAVGSNIFDILIGLGLPWLIVSVFSKKEILVATENLYSSVFLLFATVIAIMFLLILRRFKLNRLSGFFLVFLYILYLVWAIIQAV